MKKIKLKESNEEIELLAKEGLNVTKVSRRDIPYVVANKLNGATTVASTMILAELAGVKIFATGGIGGLYRHSTNFRHLTGDAIAIAIKHGVELKDINYVHKKINSAISKKALYIKNGKESNLEEAHKYEKEAKIKVKEIKSINVKLIM